MTSPSRCLIGSTGFVGGSLQRQAIFDVAVHSADVDSIRGRSFDLVVCAGAPAAKWKANREPEADLAGIRRLIDVLSTVEAARFALVSTVDVFGQPRDVWEDSPVVPEVATPYGRHRRLLEEAAARRFRATIIRLPGLFGAGLRKNVIFDLLHGNEVEKIHPEGVFQYYEIERLWSHLTWAFEHGVRLLHLPSEPIRTGELARRCFGIDLAPRPDPPPSPYDMRSRHSAEFGRSDGYMFGREETLAAVAQFARRSRSVTP